MTDRIQDAYNKLELLPDIPASIVEYLINNNDTAFKLLFYNSPDAWAKPNLTTDQKRALVYDGSARPEDFRIFLDTGQDSSLVEQISILRVSVLEYIPKNYVLGYCSIAVEVYSHYLINTMSNYKTRVDSIIQSVLSTINGANIDNTSRLFFDYSQNPRSKITTIGTPPFKGKVAILYTYAK